MVAAYPSQEAFKDHATDDLNLHGTGATHWRRYTPRAASRPFSHLLLVLSASVKDRLKATPHRGRAAICSAP